MSPEQQWIGIDVAKAWLDVASSGEERVWRVRNERDGITTLVEELVVRLPSWWCWRPPADTKPR